MKKLKNWSSLLLVLSIAFFSASCSDDDDGPKEIIPGTPTGTDVRYEFSVSSKEPVTTFKYKKADGNMDYGNLTIDSPLKWTKTIIVKKPFQTKMELNFQNKTGQEQTYRVDIFIDGILKNTQSGTISIPPVPPVNPAIPYPPVSITTTYDLE